MTLILDYSWARPSPATIKAAGYDGVMRYLSDDPTKNLSPAEAAGLHAAGLSIGLIWEQGKARAGDGFAAGVADARSAEAQAIALGHPRTAPIFYAVDSGGLTVAMVIPYFGGIKSVATYPVGVYGSYKIVEGVAVPWKWQCYAWSNKTDAAGNAYPYISPQAHLYQRLHKTVAHPIPITDENVVLRSFPMWMVGSAMTTPPAVLTVAKSQLGYIETSSNITRYWAELEPGLQGNPWCAVFVSWVFKHAGFSLPAMGKSYGFVYVPNAVNYAKAHGLWDESGHYAPGDIVCYGNGAHTGIIVSDNGTIMAVYEGNTSPDNSAGSQTNGGGVYLRHRPHSDWVNGVIKTSRLLSTSTTTPTEEIDMPLTLADADLVVKRLLGTEVAPGLVVKTVLQRAAVAPATVASGQAGGSTVTAEAIAKAVVDLLIGRLES